jgi:hypothetical protein
VVSAVTITEPGVYDIPEDEYHADPVPGGSLSASGAKKLLACPARFDYDRRHPPAPSTSMELGTAVHKLVLGKGAEIVTVDADSWRKKADQETAKAARAAGHVPLLVNERLEAQAMADAVLAHPDAARLFTGGKAEQSLFWQDDEFGIWRRARLDWLPDSQPRQRMIIPDLKTCKPGGAAPREIPRAVASYDYHIQAATYTDAIEALGLAADPAFVFVFVETAPPYLITIAQLDNESMDEGWAVARAACERYRDCMKAGIWPGYAQDIVPISLPRWAYRDLESL